MVEDAPDDLVHEIFTQQFWPRHPLGRPILGSPGSVSSFDEGAVRTYFDRTYRAPNLLVAAAGHVDHARLRDLVSAAFAAAPVGRSAEPIAPPQPVSGVALREKDIEQSHVCLGGPAPHQSHEDRHALYVLNTILGGSMSSRLFQHIREDRGLAYAVFSSLTTYSDAGMISVYAGCAAERVAEVVDLSLIEIRKLRDVPVPAVELRRAKDHLKGSLMLSLESTSSRMSNLARQLMSLGRHVSLDEMLASIERVTAEDVQRVAVSLFGGRELAASVVGPAVGAPLAPVQLRI
jgi:predicted Zn-dependent peptidase